MLKHRSHRPGHAHEEHKAHAPKTVTCVVITCSDTRNAQTDISGQLMMRLLKEHGHDVAGYHLIKDEPTHIRRLITCFQAHLENDVIHVLLPNEDTGRSVDNPSHIG